MGTDATSNNLNNTLEGYEHIVLANDLEQTHWSMLQLLEREVSTGQFDADWLDAIIVAIDLLKLHRLAFLATEFLGIMFNICNTFFTVPRSLRRLRLCY